MGDNPEKLRGLAGENKKIVIIGNALDVYSDQERRAESERKQAEPLQELGLEPEILNLRNYFDRQNDLKIKMQEFGMFRVMGGNTFVLRYAMEKKVDLMK